MVFNRSDRNVEPDRDLLLRHTLHFAKYEDLCALWRQSGNRARQHTNTLTTVDDIIRRSLTTIL